MLLGFSFGALLLAHKGVPYAPWLWAWRPAHIEFLLMGLDFAIDHGHGLLDFAALLAKAAPPQ
jgi:hypothetical protein